MSSSHYGDDGGDTQARNDIYDIWEELRLVRKQYQREQQNGGVSADTREAFQAIVMVYYDELRKYRTHPAVEDIWREGGPWDGGLSRLEQLATEPEEVTIADTSVRGGQETTRRKPQLLSAWQLYKVSHDLDDVAIALDVGIQTEPPEEDTDPI